MFYKASLFCACLSLVCAAHAVEEEKTLLPVELEIEEDISEDDLLFDAIAAMEDIDVDDLSFDDESDELEAMTATEMLDAEEIEKLS